MSKKSATKVEAAPASITKPLKKGKRDAQYGLDIQVKPKKYKTELIPPVQAAKKALPKKVETSSSDSSDSEEEHKAESNSSEDESSSDEEPTPPKKQQEVVKNVKIAEPAVKDPSSSEEEPEDEKEPATKKLMSKSDSSEEDSDDEENTDEKPPKKKAEVSSTKTSKQESTSDESSEEESEDEKVTPKKKPKTPATQTQGGSKTLFAANLSFQIERSDVEKFFKEVGEVVDVRFGSHEDGSLKGFGHVEFASAEAAQKALNLHGKALLGRKVRLNLAKEKKVAYDTPRSSNTRVNYQKSGKGEGSQSNTVYVKGFDTSVGEHEIKNALRGLFSACGEITRIAVLTDRETGASRGMAFIDLKDGVNKALELSGTEILGRNIVVNEARPKGESGDGSSGRFSTRGRGRDNRGRGRDSGGLDKPSVLASAQGKKKVFIDD